MSAERIQEFIASCADIKSVEAFLADHPYPFLVQEKVKGGATPVREDRTTMRLSSAKAPAGDGFMQGDVWIHRIYPRDPENNEGAVTLGREEACDLVVEDGSISTLHAKFSLEFGEDDEKAFYVTDADSSNGTYLNGEKLEPDAPAEVSDMDSIRFGPAVKFQFFTAPAFYQFMDMYRRIKKPQ